MSESNKHGQFQGKILEALKNAPSPSLYVRRTAHGCPFARLTYMVISNTTGIHVQLKIL